MRFLLRKKQKRIQKKNKRQLIIKNTMVTKVKEKNSLIKIDLKTIKKLKIKKPKLLKS